MTLKPLSIAFVVVAMFASSARESSAQTVSNGPYYATPSWDQKLACDTPATCPRFIVLANWNNEAVLDRETGLVWERAPLAPCMSPIFCNRVDIGTRNWLDAHTECRAKVVGDRAGWRLPTFEELATLQDVDAGRLGGLVRLPPGHPFIGVQRSYYWTASMLWGGPAFGNDKELATAVYFGPGAPTDAEQVAWTYQNLVNPHSMWCVRAGTGARQ